MSYETLIAERDALKAEIETAQADLRHLQDMEANPVPAPDRPEPVAVPEPVYPEKPTSPEFATKIDADGTARPEPHPIGSASGRPIGPRSTG